MNFLLTVRLLSVIAMMAFTHHTLADDQTTSPDTPQKAILVTGASSGIGLTITKHLAAQGYFVYAGARKEEDLIALNKIPNVQSIRLDVTVQEDIDNAVKTVTQANRGLYGLVNNAGVGLWGPLVETEEKDFDFLMNVNVYGPYRITRAFHPLIIASQGYIIMTGSLFGTTTMPMMGPYAMSKHAIEAFTDTLAAEMAPYGVKVSVVEPGTYKSQIYKKIYNRALEAHKNNNAELAEWQKQLFAMGPGVHDNYPPPDKVAETVSRILVAKKPKRRYLVVPEKEQAESTIKAAIKKVVQLNEGYEYSLDKTQLINIVEETTPHRKKIPPQN